MPGALGPSAAGAYQDPQAVKDAVQAERELVVRWVGLLAAAVLGGMLAWAGPMAYLVLTETMLSGGRSSAWVWPTKPPHDLAAALCAASVFVAGAVLVMLRGPRESARD